jgi:uncharacterized RDD family membrane protein YckC
MSNPAGDIGTTPSGATPPTRKTRRAQTAIDSGATLIFTMLAWPFPLARASLTPAVNVLSVLVLWQLLQIAYFAVTMSVWGATGGTRVMGLRVVGTDGTEPSRRQRALWGALSGAMAVVRVVAPAREGKLDLPERVAEVEVIATSAIR